MSLENNCRCTCSFSQLAPGELRSALGPHTLAPRQATPSPECQLCLAGLALAAPRSCGIPGQQGCSLGQARRPAFSHFCFWSETLRPSVGCRGQMGGQMDATTIKASVLEEGSTALASHPLPRQMGSPWQAPFLRSRPGWMPPPAPCFCVDRVLVDLSYAGSGLFLPRLGIMLLNLAQALPRAATLPGWLGPRAVAARVEPKHPLRKYLPPLIAVAPCLPGCEACACGGLLGPAQETGSRPARPRGPAQPCGLC